MNASQGYPVRLHFYSTDITNAAAISLIPENETAVTSITAPDKLYIQSLVISAAADALVRLFCDSNDDDALDAGEELVDAILGSTGLEINFGNLPLPCEAGIIPKVIGTAAKAASVSGMGFIVKKTS